MEKKRLCRSSNGKVMGVCAGIANWLNMDVSLVRLGFILGSIFSGGVVIFVYIALGVFLPVDNGDSGIFNKVKDGYAEQKYESRSRNKRRVDVNDIKNEFDNLKNRVSSMENKVFDKEKDWDERFKNS